MSKNTTASDFKALFAARTAIARHRAGYTQETMAADLGMKQSTYHKYEKRTYLPHLLVPRFCMLCKITPEWLYSAAVDQAELAAAQPPRKPRIRRKKAKKVA